MRALVYRSTGSWYDVKDESGKSWKARLKGVLRIDNITSTNPVAVGDWIEMSEESDGTASIVDIVPRENYITRQSPHNKNAHHIVGSNLDQTILVATIREPRTSQGFIDRFLLVSEAYHIPAVLVFNKCDSWKAKDEEQFAAWQQMYSAAGYTVKKVSAKTGEGVEDIQASVAEKKSLLSGHSGVGKSSLLNALLPELDLHTSEVSSWSGKGTHTTTFAEMFDLPGGGQVIDTPGVREFGLVHITRNELSHYFPEMLAVVNDCQFNNCLHVNEPGCAVKAAVNDETIHVDRYVSYLGILDTIEEKWR